MEQNGNFIVQLCNNQFYRMISLFTFLVCSVVSNELLFISLESEYHFTIFSNLIYPMGIELQSGIDQENNIYFYDVTTHGINTGSDIFTIGIWIKGNSQSEKQFIMSIMSIDGASEIVYLENDQIMTIEGNSFEYIDEVWVYVFFLQLDLSSQLICYLDLSITYDLQCQQFSREGEYYLFSFLQPSIFQTELYEIYPWQGEAISITAKLLNMQYDIFDNPIKSLIISNYVELNVIFDLKLYERTQTNVLKDWSDNQHIVKIGNTINPIIIPNQQLLSFQNQNILKLKILKFQIQLLLNFNYLMIFQQMRSLYSYFNLKSQLQMYQQLRQISIHKHY
ncbi:unnamed protein product [Paramecium primaurelia]|uniref:Uncharacterized protein n=1 Tax=Paramecium primaurelia TaxID=5886 RepID=A0A8S1NYJ3_PARPR|nr:unnamed protein product [Paramecium primaurelia]